MSELNLTQSEADALIAMEKHCTDEEQHLFPTNNESLMLALHSPDKREHFLLDLSRGRIDLLKVKMQNRGRKVIVLVRLDLGGAPHCNPDGEVVQPPHLHVYQEGYGDKWAFPVPAEHFHSIDDLWTTFHDFMRYCNIKKLPNFQRGLFI